MCQSRSWWGRGPGADVHPLGPRATNYIGGTTQCKGAQIQFKYWKRAPVRTRGLRIGYSKPVGMEPSWLDPLGPYTGKVQQLWQFLNSERTYLPAVTYFPTPSPEQYRRR